MNIAGKSRIFLTKLQNLSDSKKKVILWAIVVVAGLIMGTFWVRGTINNLSKVGDVGKLINFPVVNLPSMPSLPSLNLLQTTTPTDENPIVDNIKNQSDQTVQENLSPDQVVKEFYEGNGEVNKDLSGIKIADSQGMYDPIICAQSDPDVSTSYATVSQNNTDAIVEIHNIYSGSGDNVITVLLKMVESQWKITEIICPKK